MRSDTSPATMAMRPLRGVEQQAAGVVDAGGQAFVQHFAAVEDGDGLALPAVQQVPARAEGGEAGAVERRSASARPSSSAAIRASRSMRASQGTAATARPICCFQFVRHQPGSGRCRSRPRSPPSCAACGFDQDAGQLVAVLQHVVRPFQLHRLRRAGQRFGQRHADRQRQAGQLLQRRPRSARPARRSASGPARTASCGRRGRGPRSGARR